MKQCLAICRAWFSADGFTFWDSPQTKTGRINCYFKAPTAGNYVCTAQLESYGGPAQVECLIDAFNFGPLGFNGAISQPHPAALSAGYHSFRIRQKAGAFFFVGLTVWKSLIAAKGGGRARARASGSSCLPRRQAARPIEARIRNA